MRRLYLSTYLLVCAAPAVPAQGVVSGYAIAVDTDRPLACLEVLLLNAQDERVASTRTHTDGAFKFVAPDSGPYRMLFLASGYRPVASDPALFAPDSDLHRRYLVALSPDTSRTAYADTAAFMRWIPTLASGSPRHPRGRDGAPSDGEAVARFTIDTTGSIVPGSVHIESSTHAAFARSVREYLGWARFQPPVSFKGTRMCAFVRQPFQFAIGGRRR